MIQGDALDVLERLDPGSHGALFTDPPYSSGGMFRGDRMAAPSTKYQKSSARGSHPEFMGDNRDQRSFAVWSERWLRLAWRALEPGALAVIFTDWRQLPTLTDAIQVAGFTWRGILVWDKSLSARPQPGRFRAQAEYMVWASKGPLPPAKGKPPGPGVFRLPVCHQRKIHIADKPVALCRDVLPLLTGPILDPFAGAGPIGLAAIEAGKGYLGIEADPYWHRVASSRLAEAAGENGAAGSWSDAA
jgi:site-specific DNA-methyltransferase (adenine-specific)